MSGKKGDIYLGLADAEALVSPFGRKLQITDEEIGREQRTASGRLVRDITAVKKKIVLAYETIDGDALAAFIDLYFLYSELSIFSIIQTFQQPRTTRGSITTNTRF